MAGHFGRLPKDVTGDRTVFLVADSFDPETLRLHVVKAIPARAEVAAALLGRRPGMPKLI